MGMKPRKTSLARAFERTTHFELLWEDGHTWITLYQRYRALARVQLHEASAGIDDQGRIIMRLIHIDPPLRFTVEVPMKSSWLTWEKGSPNVIGL